MQQLALSRSVYNKFYMVEQGEWLKWYIISHYAFYIVQKLVQIRIIRVLEAELDKKKGIAFNSF